MSPSSAATRAIRLSRIPTLSTFGDEVTSKALYTGPVTTRHNARVHAMLPVNLPIWAKLCSNFFSSDQPINQQNYLGTDNNINPI